MAPNQPKERPNQRIMEASRRSLKFIRDSTKKRSHVARQQYRESGVRLGRDAGPPRRVPKHTTVMDLRQRVTDSSELCTAWKVRCQKLAEENKQLKKELDLAKSKSNVDKNDREMGTRNVANKPEELNPQCRELVDLIKLRAFARDVHNIFTTDESCIAKVTADEKNLALRVSRDTHKWVDEFFATATLEHIAKMEFVLDKQLNPVLNKVFTNSKYRKC